MTGFKYVAVYVTESFNWQENTENVHFQSYVMTAIYAFPADNVKPKITANTPQTVG